MEKIEFTQNWNNKLNCKAFTTIRLKNERKYQKSYMYEIYLKGINKGKAKCVDINEFTINELTEHICHTDTGYDKKATINIMKRMYEKIVRDWDNQRFQLITLIYI